MKYVKWQQVCSLITCFLIMLAVAINRDQQFFGKTLLKSGSDSQTDSTANYVGSDGMLIISTDELAKDVVGYGGNVPLKIYLKDGKVSKIEALKNAETPGFFRDVEQGVLPQWNGLTVDEALKKKVDGISGATLSSNAVIESVKRGLMYSQGIETVETSAESASIFSLKFVCTVLVILAGAIVPIFVRSPRYRMAQLLLNVVVLGFWSGSFISYSLLVNYISNGLNVWAAVIPVLLLIIAFVFPLFGKKSHYCNWVCPLGSLQEVVGKSVKYKFYIRPRYLKFLNYFRDGLWALLMLLMWAGVCFEWMDYELFTAFIFQQASTAVLVLAIVFLLLSCVVVRPYCRFVCPTGTLFRISQNTK
ncbi:FMN-binding protein [Bacteroides reticulotermitis]|uniref:FMN-binding protein n=1 Tax=Bacteroides reticulotermitis TaxID=1133319 RepID=UPI003A857F5F